MGPDSRNEGLACSGHARERDGGLSQVNFDERVVIFGLALKVISSGQTVRDKPVRRALGDSGDARSGRAGRRLPGDEWREGGHGHVPHRVTGARIWSSLHRLPFGPGAWIDMECRGVIASLSLS